MGRSAHVLHRLARSRLARLWAITTTVTLVLAQSALAAGVPNPGQGVAPPGSADFLKILSWGAWAVFVACVGGVLYSAGKMAFAHSSGGYGGQHQSQLLWVLAACVIAGSASGIVGALA